MSGTLKSIFAGVAALVLLLDCELHSTRLSRHSR